MGRGAGLVWQGTRLACQRVHLHSTWKMMCLWTKTKSHSTCSLNLSGISTLHTLSGPSLTHSRHTLHVWTMSGMRCRTFSDTPTLSKNLFITCSEACHQRTWSFLRASLMAPSRLVRKSLTTRPISKLVQSLGFSGLSPWSLHARLCLGSWSGPRVALGSPLASVN